MWLWSAQLVPANSPVAHDGRAGSPTSDSVMVRGKELAKIVKEKNRTYYEVYSLPQWRRLSEDYTQKGGENAENTENISVFKRYRIFN